ncbi:polysaccharide biosynthesis/export family protein [Tellurirhabdus bombi]|uniref:polysaccharide biosynthesis/export family protein n=1 Tax=Tellurirhabdus bombi TaxID=2907205 RepID=UPI001F35C154|nr:polysaccharide biosynthesis/export family protein [Tellurirhabdus bombi]
MKSIYTNFWKTLFLALFFSHFIYSLSFAQDKKGKKSKDLVTYFQILEARDSVQSSVNVPVFRLQPGTEISITVSSLNKEADLVFNPVLAVRSSREEVTQIPGYVLDTEGQIDFPMLGKVKLMNMTTQEASELIKEPLRKHLSDPFVTVRVLNFQVSVLGEVNKPTVLNIHRSRLTVPEAISMAGDLTIYGKRESVLVIREADGKREFGRIDLHDRSLFSSPYYYLKPNDVIYVEPQKSKKLLAGKLFPWLPTILSGLSLIGIVTANVLR